MIDSEFYKHFETVGECDQYAVFHGYTYRRCCGGTGICIPIDTIEVPIRINYSKTKKIIRKKHKMIVVVFVWRKRTM